MCIELSASTLHSILRDYEIIRTPDIQIMTGVGNFGPPSAPRSDRRRTSVGISDRAVVARSARMRRYFWRFSGDSRGSPSARPSSHPFPKRLSSLVSTKGLSSVVPAKGVSRPPCATPLVLVVLILSAPCLSCSLPSHHLFPKRLSSLVSTKGLSSVVPAKGVSRPPCATP